MLSKGAGNWVQHAQRATNLRWSSIGLSISPTTWIPKELVNPFSLVCRLKSEFCVEKLSRSTSMDFDCLCWNSKQRSFDFKFRQLLDNYPDLFLIPDTQNSIVLPLRIWKLPPQQKRKQQISGRFPASLFQEWFITCSDTSFLDANSLLRHVFL